MAERFSDHDTPPGPSPPPHRRARPPSARRPQRRIPQALEHWTGFALIAAADSAVRHYTDALARVDLTIQQFVVMSVIARRDGIVATDIARRLGLTRQQISATLCDLDRTGYVGRELKLNDLRYKGVWLTRAGRDAFEEARAAIDGADDILHFDMAKHRRVALRKLLLGIVPPEGRLGIRLGRFLR